MANHLSSCSDNSSPGHGPTGHTLADRVAALELFTQQLVLVLEAQGTLDAQGLDAWLTLSRAAMLRTGSVAPGPVLALTRLQRQVRQ